MRKVLRELKDQEDHKEVLVQLGQQVLQERRVHEVLWVPKEHKERLDLKVFKDQEDLKETQESWVLQVLKEHKG